MNQIAPEKREEIENLFFLGKSIRHVAATAGISKVTAGKIRKTIPVLPNCACGRNAGHRGWCRIRVAQSPARQKLLMRLHHRQALIEPFPGAVSRTLPPGAKMISDALSDTAEAANCATGDYWHYCSKCGGWIEGDALRVPVNAPSDLTRPALNEIEIRCRRHSHLIKTIDS